MTVVLPDVFLFYFIFLFVCVCVFLNKDIPCFYTKVHLTGKSPPRTLKMYQHNSRSVDFKVKTELRNEQNQMLRGCLDLGFLSFVVCLVGLLPPLPFNVFLIDNIVTCFRNQKI